MATNKEYVENGYVVQTEDTYGEKEVHSEIFKTEDEAKEWAAGWLEDEDEDSVVIVYNIAPMTKGTKTEVQWEDI